MYALIIAPLKHNKDTLLIWVLSLVVLGHDTFIGASMSEPHIDELNR